MKRLKFNHDLALLIKDGKKNLTLRMYDDKALSVNDYVELIDKVVADKPATWKVIGNARIESIVEKRLSAITGEELGAELYADRTDMLRAYRIYYGDQVTLETAVKVIRFRLDDDRMAHLPKEKSNEYVDGRDGELRLFADGGSRGNPGPSAGGYVIIGFGDDVLVKRGVYLGVTTNNQAEYIALRLGLEEAHKMGVKRLHVYMDSLLVINQMLGRFKIRNRELWPVHDAVKHLIDDFTEVTFTHIPRAMNRLADAAVNEALDSEGD